jgi:hypothetical protein
MTALNGRILLRRPRLYQSYSAIEEEEEEIILGGSLFSKYFSFFLSVILHP